MIRVSPFIILLGLITIIAIAFMLILPSVTSSLTAPTNTSITWVQSRTPAQSDALDRTTELSRPATMEPVTGCRNNLSDSQIMTLIRMLGLAARVAATNPELVSADPLTISVLNQMGRFLAADGFNPDQFAPLYPNEGLYIIHLLETGLIHHDVNVMMQAPIHEWPDGITELVFLKQMLTEYARGDLCNAPAVMRYVNYIRDFLKKF